MSLHPQHPLPMGHGCTRVQDEPLSFPPTVHRDKTKGKIRMGTKGIQQSKLCAQPDPEGWESAAWLLLLHVRVGSHKREQGGVKRAEGSHGSHGINARQQQELSLGDAEVMQLHGATQITLSWNKPQGRAELVAP